MGLLDVNRRKTVQVIKEDRNNNMSSASIRTDLDWDQDAWNKGTVNKANQDEWNKETVNNASHFDQNQMHSLEELAESMILGEDDIANQERAQLDELVASL